MNRISHLRFLALILACQFSLAGLSIAQDDKGDRARQYENLKKAFDQKNGEFAKAIEAKRPPEELAKLRPSVEDFGKQLMKLATDIPADAVGCDCLVWVASHGKPGKELEHALSLIVGMNCGDEKEKVAKTMAKEKMTWPSFLDGDLGEGQIGKRWNVDGLPTVYLISAKGEILRNREFDLSDPSNKLLLERAIRQTERK